MKLTTDKTSGRVVARLKTGNRAQPYVKISLGTKSKAEAKRKADDANLVQIEAAMQSGNLSQQTISRLTVGRKFTAEQAADRWLAAGRNRGESEATTAKSQAVIQQWFRFVPAVRATIPMAITEEHVSAFVNRKDAKVGFATRQRQLSVIRMFLRYCADMGLTQGNVAASSRLEVQHRTLSHDQLEPMSREPFTAAEVKRILANTEGWWRWATGISSATGLRLGDICDLESAALTVPGHLVVHTHKRLRRVCLPINDHVTPGLSEILSEIPPNDTPFLFPEQHEQYADIAKGRPKFSIYFGRILDRIGIDRRGTKSFHSLRHTAISHWDRIGFDLNQCAEYAGHGSTEVTKGYIHG